MNEAHLNYCSQLPYRAPGAARLTQIMVPTGAERDHVGIAMMIPMRHARFASLPERIRSTCVETVSENTMDEKRIARMLD